MEMKRDLIELTRNTYDLLVIGGGIYGACLVWEASLRGLSAALVEKADFGSATSANSLKIIHGGFRYLQQADFKRMRESIHERKTLMRIAPHLVHPLPVLIPTYGHGIRGKEVLALALAVNDLVSFDRNRLEDRQKHIPRSRVISREECLQLLPGIRQQGLTGGAVFYDAQVYNSERLPLSFLRSAAKAGAYLANYVKVTGFLKEGDYVTGVKARDVLSGDQFDIRATTVVNTSGPWVNRVLGLLNGQQPRFGVRLAKAINLVTRRPLFQTYAVGISSQSRYRDADAVINKGSRFLFIAPWRGQSLIGTKYVPYNGDPDDLKLTENDIRSFLDEINQAYPLASLRREDISFAHLGLVSILGIDPETDSVQLVKHCQIHDHQQGGVKGLISVMSVKYTTARHVAEKVIDRVFETRRQKPPPSTSAVTPLHGGQIEQFEAFLHTEIGRRPCGLGEQMVRHLIYNYGSAYPQVLQYFDRHANESRMMTEHVAVLRAQARYAVREEMAQKLADVVFRRTELGTDGHPGDETLRFCAEVMETELGWSQVRIQQELQEVNQSFAWGNQ